MTGHVRACVCANADRRLVGAKLRRLCDTQDARLYAVPAGAREQVRRPPGGWQEGGGKRRLWPGA